MILFPWLVAFAFLVLLAMLVLSAPSLIRTRRARGATPFLRPAITTSLLLASLFALVILTWALAGGGR